MFEKCGVPCERPPMLIGTDEWAQDRVEEKASNFVSRLLTSFTYDKM